MERGMAERVSGCADEVDPRHYSVFALDRQHVPPARSVGLDAASAGVGAPQTGE
jgi:hypothetical protein